MYTSGGPTAAVFAILVATASAHMEMKSPAPFNSKYNPYTEQSRIDYSMTNPLATDGSDFPCKGYHALLGTPAGRPTAELEAGAAASVAVVGGATHGGGSCQVSLSTDGARSFAVLKSVIGGCPSGTDGEIAFTVPADAPAGDAVLAWSWHNRIGNREMYMNCAAVTIISSSSSSSVHGLGSSGSSGSSGVAFSSRPGLFVANVGNGCSVAEGGDVSYPDPGQDVVDQSTNPVAPAGNCGSPSSSSSHVGSERPGPAEGPRRPVTTQTTTTTRRPPPPDSVPTFIAGSGGSDGAGSGSGRPDSEKSNNDGSSSGGSEGGGSHTGGSSAGLIAPGLPCTEEGIWNCLPGGSSFQRCASGLWSVEMFMAAGTGCSPGVGYDFQIMGIRH